MIGFLSGNEAIIVVAVILLLFGSSQVPKLARNLGKAQKEFKDGLDEAKAGCDDERPPPSPERRPARGPQIDERTTCPDLAVRARFRVPEPERAPTVYGRAHATRNPGMARPGRRAPSTPTVRSSIHTTTSGPPAACWRTASTSSWPTRVRHNIVQTVFIECGAGYRTTDPTSSVRSERPSSSPTAAEDLARRHPDAAPIDGIVAHADLAHPNSTRSSTRTSRRRWPIPGDTRLARPRGRARSAPHPGQYGEGKSEARRSAAAWPGSVNSALSYDCWLYHHQNVEFAALARAVPETTMVWDHFGTPVGVGRFAGRHDEIFEQWKRDTVEIATCENTVAKLGGLAMPDNGFDFHVAEAPPTSDHLLEAQRRWYEHTIECFGPERCMFESNFQVDRMSLSYTVYWNAMQKLAASFSETEQQAMFAGTARRVYRLDG